MFITEDEVYGGDTIPSSDWVTKAVRTEVRTQVVEAGEQNQEEEVDQRPRTEETEMPPVEGGIEEIVDLTGEDEVMREKEGVDKPGVRGRGEGQDGIAEGSMSRGRQLILEAEEDEEEEEAKFPLIEEPPSREKILRETAITYRASPVEVPKRRRTRKGKEIAKPIPKKGKKPSTTVIIQEPRPERAMIRQEEEASESNFDDIYIDGSGGQRNCKTGLKADRKRGRKRIHRTISRHTSAWIGNCYPEW